MDVIQLDKYLTQNKLLFKPDFFIRVLTRFDKLKDSMVQKVALQKANDPETCKYCDSIKESTNGKFQFCKKHKAIHDWETLDVDKSGVGMLFGYKVQLFKRYCICSMPTDDNGVYIIYFGNSSDKGDCVYCVSKEYFPGIFETGYNISSLYSENNVVVYKHKQIYWDNNNPRLIILNNKKQKHPSIKAL